METTFIIAIFIGLVLGGIIVWLYRKSVVEKNSISAAEHDGVKNSLQEKQIELAVANGKTAAYEKDLDDAKALIDRLRTSEQKCLGEIEAMKSAKDHALGRSKELTDENRNLSEQIKSISNSLKTAENTITRLEEELRGKECIVLKKVYT